MLLVYCRFIKQGRKHLYSTLIILQGGKIEFFIAELNPFWRTNRNGRACWCRWGRKRGALQLYLSIMQNTTYSS